MSTGIIAAGQLARDRQLGIQIETWHEIQRLQVALVGRADNVRARFYAVSVERRLKHPAVVAIADAAREKLFG